MTETELRLQYAERTWNIEFPELIEEVLENDYVRNPAHYTKEMFGFLELTLVIAPDTSPSELLDIVRKQHCELSINS